MPTLRLSTAELCDDVELLFGHWLDRQPAAALDDDHLLEPERRLECRDRDDLGKTLDEADVDHVPGWLLRLTLRIVVGVRRIESKRVRIALARDLRDANHAGGLGVRGV